MQEWKRKLFVLVGGMIFFLMFFFNDFDSYEDQETNTSNTVCFFKLTHILKTFKEK